MLSTYTPVDNMTDDGNEVFFQSFARLVLADQNDTQDVYEWAKPGTGACQEGGPAFQASAAGCLYLISSGRSPSPSYLYAATPSGDDVFFRTAASLVPRDIDGGIPSIYDGRIGGGFDEAAGAPQSCQGESCREDRRGS
jgi:hypothetical protein